MNLMHLYQPIFWEVQIMNKIIAFVVAFALVASVGSVIAESKKPVTNTGSKTPLL